MWQASQSALMSKIIASGMSCVLVKVAGVGLEERDLGRTLNVLEPKLRRLNASYGLHICGEGGEYETVTLDSPLFHERISLYDSAARLLDICARQPC
jgi:diphthine-ammonia ligase